MQNPVREEREIFSDLIGLCSSAGYAHVIAYVCFKNNAIGYANEIKPKDILQQHSEERLVRAEISTLIGLMFKKDIDFTLPEPERMKTLIEETEILLKEIHHSMMKPVINQFDISMFSEEKFNPFANGPAMREPIFYGGESAYSFQYLDFAIKKYQEDNQWFVNNKGFSIDDAKKVISSIGIVQNKKLMANLEQLKSQFPDRWTMLPAFSFSTSEIIDQSKLDKTIIDKVLKAFIPPDGLRNKAFNALNDFNITNAYPIIYLCEDEYLLFQYYSLVEALYESPFYWLSEDKSYFNEAMKNRGAFTEEFCRERLESVFGKNRVFSNIDIIDSKRNKAGEIDVLVVYANRAIILQAKSKKLTLEARKGNDSVLKDNFKKSIQDSYNQALSCSKLLTDNNYKLVNSNNREMNISRSFKEIYIFCVVSEHYPALSFQTRQFLTYEQKGIMPPFVMDIFLLDVMCEMLNSPLQFLSYINKRALYFENINATHELTVLSYHLIKNLWLENENDMLLLDDDLSVDLDAAMLVRRQGLPGDATPKGILTCFKETSIGTIIQQIERREIPATIDLGFMLLTLSEDTVFKISNGIETIAHRAKIDGNHHDFTVAIGGGDTGLTIHCNYDSMDVAKRSLESHCELRKYTQKAKRWFGICLDPDNLLIKFGLELNYEWKYSEHMEAISSNLPKVRKIGRNELCPCGSGLKYKKCCYNR